MSPSREEDPLLVVVLTVDAVAEGENTVVVLAEGTSSSPLPSPALFVGFVAIEP
ncbi:molecular chaperone [Sesbania bispinosa]|nr:molecular chaperone [Sesbania bispinosa]